MSLRLRLVLGLVALLVLGLGSFGIATYSWYSPTQYQRLDDQLSASLPFVSVQLLQKAGIASAQPGGGHGGGPGGSGDDDSGGGPGPGGGNGPGNPTVPVNAPIPPGTFAELINARGQVLSRIAYLTSSQAAPKLPETFVPVGAHGRVFTTGSVAGSTTWQVLVSSASPSLAGDVVVVAIPTGGVTGALHHLLLIEAAVALGLLVLLSAGSWLLLRRGLRPLEQMATTARSIASGDLSQRVGAEGGPSEIAELGRALNTMLSDIENAFAERAETEQRLRRFLADASHELRTPLTSIQGFAELFRIGMDSEHVDQATIARRIEDEAARMRTLVEDLLLLARLDLAPEPQQEPVDLAVLAADACSDAVAMAPDRPVTLDAPERVEVLGDSNHLRQAVANLIANAVRHTPAGSPIDVTARLDGDMGVVQVRDHGPGLDAEALAHAFDRLWQANSARSGEGAGLGLSIVAAVAAEHGGTAEASNVQANGDGPGDSGHGAVFLIRVPARRPAA
ncbi:MAG TPA: HAMP domain-containing sensor histidine kinase [Acidimicrobiales bacterium]|nr:HAMP domain-containing sensor histidine kinase [Acidimicrobiales bacterium]